MAYGSALGVAAHVPRFANESHRFDNTTTPTLAQVDEWREQISAALDVAMAAAALPAPATNTAVVDMLAGFVNGNAAWLAESVNGQGRFQERPATTTEILAAIQSAAASFVTANARGMGAISGVASGGVAAGAGAWLSHRVDDYSYYPPSGEYGR